MSPLRPDPNGNSSSLVPARVQIGGAQPNMQRMPNVRPYIVNDPAHAHQVALAGPNAGVGFMPTNAAMPRADQNSPARPHADVPAINGGVKRAASENLDSEPEYKRRRTQAEQRHAAQLLTAAERRQYRASFSDDGHTLLSLAIRLRDDDAVDMLLAGDLLEESERIEAVGALLIAAFAGNLYGMERLLQAGADLVCGIGYVVRRTNSPQSLRLLLSNPVPEEAKEKLIADCLGAMYTQFIKVDSEVGGAFLDAYPELSLAKDKNGFTVLHMAAHQNRWRMIGNLCKRGAKVNATSNSGLTALMFAAHGGHEDAVRKLMEYGAQINTQNLNGHNALWFATKNGHLALVRKLLAAGADPIASATPSDKNTGVAVLDPSVNVSAIGEATARSRYSAVWLMLQYVDLKDVPEKSLRCAPAHAEILQDVTRHARRISPTQSPTEIMAFGEHGIPVSLGLNPILSLVLTDLGRLNLCSPLAKRLQDITPELKLFQQLVSHEKLLSDLPAQERAVVAGILIDQEDWVKSWPENWSPYEGLCDSEELSSRLTALLRKQAAVLGEIGRHAEQELLVPALQDLPLQFFTLLFEADPKPALIRMLCNSGLFHPHASRVAHAWWQTREQHHAGIDPPSVASTQAAEAFSKTGPGKQFGRDLVAALREQLGSPQGWFSRPPPELSNHPVAIQALYAQLMWRHLYMLQQLTDGLERDFAS